jgi:5-methylcytosine-specific restriction endonuclease McrA
MTKHPLYETEFVEISGRRYRAMAQRIFEPPRSKSHSQQELFTRMLPFTLEQFRDWLFGQFPNGNATRCAYCDQPVNLLNCEIDHVIPLTNRNGTYGLDNLAVSCAECNQQKAGMTGDEFRSLLALVTNIDIFSEAGRTSVLSRLQGYVKLAKLYRGTRYIREQEKRPTTLSEIFAAEDKRQKKIRWAKVRTRNPRVE